MTWLGRLDLPLGGSASAASTLNLRAAQREGEAPAEPAASVRTGSHSPRLAGRLALPGAPSTL